MLFVIQWNDCGRRIRVIAIDRSLISSPLKSSIVRMSSHRAIMRLYTYAAVPDFRILGKSV